jgi:dTDP-4-amino-4,6-dideoxygalactose transaminase
MAIPLIDPRSQYLPYQDELNELAAEVIASGNFVLGKHVSAFEQEAADYLGVKHAIGVANGTDALTIAMRALGVRSGDEVICPAYTFYATAETIAGLGATPVFVDVDPTTACLDAEAVRSKVSDRTRAIIPVHLFGQCADMRALKAVADEHDIPVLEDAAQAWGAEQNGVKAGAMGTAATFSFYPTKNLPCFGDGGMVTTNDDALADEIRMLRFHGSRDKFTFELVGYNSRLDELQAAFLRRHLHEIDRWNAHRRKVAGWYAEAGLGDLVELPSVGDGNTPIWHLFVVRHDNRDAIIEACRASDIGAMVYYGEALHLQPVFKPLGYSVGSLPTTERLCSNGVAIPMFATMKREQVDEVVEAIRGVLA